MKSVVDLPWLVVVRNHVAKASRMRSLLPEMCEEAKRIIPIGIGGISILLFFLPTNEANLFLVSLAWFLPFYIMGRIRPARTTPFEMVGLIVGTVIGCVIVGPFVPWVKIFLSKTALFLAKISDFFAYWAGNSVGGWKFSLMVGWVVSLGCLSAWIVFEIKDWSPIWRRSREAKAAWKMFLKSGKKFHRNLEVVGADPVAKAALWARASDQQLLEYSVYEDIIGKLSAQRSIRDAVHRRKMAQARVRSPKFQRRMNRNGIKVL